MQTASDPAQVRHLIDRAIRIALEERSVTCVIVPNDLQREEGSARAAAYPRRQPQVVPRETCTAQPRS